MVFNFNDLSKQSKLGYNALYNVVLAHATSPQVKTGVNFTVPLCLNSNNKVSLTEKNFIFFESILSELKLNGYYAIVTHNGRAVEDMKTDFSTVDIVLSKNALNIPSDIKTFNFSEVDTSKLMKRNGKEEKSKTVENNAKKLEEQKTVENLKQEVAKKEDQLQKKEVQLQKKEDQLNKKALEEFNDDALMSIADCIEFLIKQHCPIPADFNFAKFENDLFKVIAAKWDLKVLDK